MKPKYLIAASLLLLPSALLAQTATPRTCKATAAAPTYVEGSFVPVSCELDGDLRTTAGAGTTTVQGSAAHDSPQAGNPLNVGGTGSSAAPTSVTAGDAVRAWHALNGAQIVGGYDGSVARAVSLDTSGRIVNVGTADNDTPPSGAPVRVGVVGRSAVPDLTVYADGDVKNPVSDPYGQLLVRNDHLNRIRCTVTVSTATTLQAVGGSCAAPGSGLSIYVTDISFDASASGIAADAFPTLKSGTNGTCGIGTAVFWGKLSAAAVAVNQSFATPLKLPANNEICWISSTAGSKFLVISGFIAP